MSGATALATEAASPARAAARALVVDDDPDYVSLVTRALGRHEIPFAVEHARDGAACLEALAARDFSVILLDYRLPRMSGLDVLARIRELGIATPVVIATAQGDERIAVQAMKAGAIDYVVKSGGYFQTLPAVLARALEQHGLAREHARLVDESRRQERQLAQIFDSTSDAILLVDAHRRLIRANARAGELFVFDPATAAGADLATLLGPGGDGDGLERLLDVLAGPEPGGSGELTAGPKRILRWTARRAAGEGSAATSTVTLHDVTDERRIGQMKSDFVSFVAHQLRTPLSGIKWMLELAREAEATEARTSFIDDAGASAERLIAMVNDLLNISRLESGGFTACTEAVALGALTREVLADLEALATERGHAVSLDEGDEVPAVGVDRELFRQVLLNLVSNAIKYTPSGGRIAVRTSAADGGAVWEVEDSGIGIPESARAHLFEKFYRADNAVTLETEGTGLGLYLVALTTRHFGGEVSWTSEEGRGTTFRLRMPAAR